MFPANGIVSAIPSLLLLLVLLLSGLELREHAPGADALPADFYAERMLNRLDGKPMRVQFVDDSLMLVLQQDGAILLADTSTVPAVLADQPYLQLPNVDYAGEVSWPSSPPKSASLSIFSKATSTSHTCTPPP